MGLVLFCMLVMMLSCVCVCFYWFSMYSSWVMKMCSFGLVGVVLMVVVSSVSVFLGLLVWMVVLVVVRGLLKVIVGVCLRGLVGCLEVVVVIGVEVGVVF